MLMRLIAALVGLGVLGLTGTAQAIPIAHTLTLTETAPGNSVSVGSFVIDSADLTPSTFIPLSSFLSFSITVLGETFVLADNSNMANEGVQTDALGTVVNFLDATPGTLVTFFNGNTFLDLGEPPGAGWICLVCMGEQHSGINAIAVQVPAPAGIPLFAVGLVALAWLSRRLRRPA